MTNAKKHAKKCDSFKSSETHIMILKLVFGFFKLAFSKDKFGTCFAFYCTRCESEDTWSITKKIHKLQFRT